MGLNYSVPDGTNEALRETFGDAFANEVERIEYPGGTIFYKAGFDGDTVSVSTKAILAELTGGIKLRHCNG